MKNRPTTAVFRLLWLKRIDASDQRSENTMKKLVQFIIVLLGMTMATTVITQQANAAEELNTVIDSLQQVIKTAKEDTIKVNTLNVLGEKLRSISDYEKALDCSEQAKQLAEKLGFKNGISNSYNNIGIVHAELGDYTEAVKNFSSSLKIREEIKDKNGVAASYNNIGRIYTFKGDYAKALENFAASLKIREEIKDKKGTATLYNNIGMVYDYQGDFSGALKNYTASLRTFIEIEDEEGIADAYNNIGVIYANQGNYPEALKNYFEALEIHEKAKNKKNIAAAYNNIGIIYDRQGDYPEALKNHLASLKIKEEIKDKRGIATSYNSIGNIHSAQGNISEALKSFSTALEIYAELGNKRGVAFSYSNIGTIYGKQGNDVEALKNHTESLKISKETGDKQGAAVSYMKIGLQNRKLGKLSEAKTYVNNGLSLSKEVGDKQTIMSGYHALAELDSIQGNWKQAYEHQQLYNIYKDSLNNEENTKKIVQAQMQYDFDKKEALTKAEQDKKDFFATKELKMKTQQRNGFIGGFAVVLLFAGVFFMQRNRISKEKARSEELLLNILPAEVAEELKDKGHSDAQLVDHVTVLFTDFKGFTALSEQLSPKELVRDLHACFSEFDRICAKYGIEKIKTIGDAYMAAGGLPSPNTTHAQDAVKAALEMAQVVEAGKAAKIAANQPFFEIRIGIHTGPVVAGIVGIKKFQYDIWGDTVNTASRMESSGEVGKVNISETTYELVKDQFVCEFRGEIEAKGKGKMKMFFVKIAEG